MSENTLYDELKKIETTNSILDNNNFNFLEKIEIDYDIERNLRYKFRPYQEEALKYYLKYDEMNTGKDNVHLLFQMATGTGKTLLMSSLILQLYKKGYNKFLFFVHRDSIVNKTRDNLLQPSSKKYLFNSEGIKINGKNIGIFESDTLTESDTENIYISIQTIQGLQEKLENPRENSMDYVSLKNEKIIMLADEAHHYSAVTKNISNDEKAWEETINKLLYLNKSNVLFEFTATIDWSQENIKKKYAPKLIFKYDLKNFMSDGYSKNVALMQVPTTITDKEKILFALLVSEYRRNLGLKYGNVIKPLILFKVSKLENANIVFREINEVILNLEISDIDSIYKILMGAQKSMIITKLLEWIKSDELIVENIKKRFQIENILQVDSKTKNNNEAFLLNTLESLENPCRVIVAVHKLTEGWDVQNLYDIVLMKETLKTKKAFISEAQLIGRGARYYPFDSNREYDKKYQRIYDVLDERTILETLHYHTLNESKVISNLKNALAEEGIEIREENLYQTVKLKKTFKRSKIYKEGNLYLNKKEEINSSVYDSFKSLGINSETFETTVKNLEENFLKENKTNDLKRFKISSVDDSMWLKAMKRNSFFRLKSLQRFFPNLKSTEEFIRNEKFLGKKTIAYLSAEEKNDKREILYILEQILRNIEITINHNYLRFKGTEEFYPNKISKVLENEYLIKSNVAAIKSKEWYVYDSIVGLNNLELELIEYITSEMFQINRKYHSAYLIRNEKKIELYNYKDGRTFQPDFILILQRENIFYQVFIEPKGSHLILKDNWKDELLYSLNTVTLSDNNLKMIGLPFFGEYGTDEREKFKEMFQKEIIDNVDFITVENHLTSEEMEFIDTYQMYYGEKIFDELASLKGMSFEDSVVSQYLGNTKNEE